MNTPKSEILYISYDGMTDPLGQSQVLPYLCGLADRGFGITLISAEKPYLFDKLQDVIRNICSSKNIDWHPVNYHRSPPIAGTLYDIHRISKIAKRLHKSKHFQLVHCRSYIPAIVGKLLKKEYDIPFLFDMRGFWADEKIDGKIWDMRNPMFRMVFSFMKKQEKYFFSFADGIISLTEKAIPEIMNIGGGASIKEKTTVIPCCVDTEHFDRRSINENALDNLAAQLNIHRNNFVLSYSGSISTWYLPRQMLDFFRVFCQKVPHAIFLIITQEDPSPFIKMAEETGVDPTKLRFRSASRQEMPSLLSLSQLSIFFIKPAFSKIASSPTKLGEILSMGIPVVCNAGIGDTDQIIERSGTGLICKKMNTDEYEEIIPEIMHLQRTVSSDAIRMEAIHHFSLTKGVDTYERVYRKLIRS